MSAPTKRQQTAGQVRSLRAMRKKLLDMSSQWEDFDQFNLNRLQELADECEQVAVDLLETD